MLAGIAGIVLRLIAELPDDMPALLAGIALLGTTAFLLPQPWLRSLLGIAAALLFYLAITEPHDASSRLHRWVAWHALLPVWLLLCALAAARREAALPAGARWQDQAFGSGWCGFLLLGLIWLSGDSFVAASALPGHDEAREIEAGFVVLQSISALLALLAAVWTRHRWRELRGAAEGGVALVLVAMAWYMPALGAVMLIAAVAAAARHDKLALGAAVAAIYIIVSIACQMPYTLAFKALVLIVPACALAALSWVSLQRDGALPAEWMTTAKAAAAPPRRRTWLGAGGIAAVLLAINAMVLHNEHLIRNGQTVFVPLAAQPSPLPAQENYLTLDFLGAIEALDSRRPLSRALVVQLNDGNIAQPLRYFSPTEQLADGEHLLPLTRRGLRHILVSETWHIRPGEAQHWSKARFGEFRRLRGGGLMLVGLADENRQPIRPD